jgi:hypothetical protein
VPESFFSLPKVLKTKKSPVESICQDKLSVNGESGFLNNAWPVLKIAQGAEDRAVFPPKIVVQIKALAYKLAYARGLPLSRFSHSDIAREAMDEEIIASISGTTVWRWLNADAIKPR